MSEIQNDYSPDPSLTPQQHRVITLIAAGQSITQAAAAENIHRNSVGYWRRTNPAFARELEFATREQRHFWHEQATQAAAEAVEVLHGTLSNPEASPSLRFRAAVTILKMATDPGSKALKGFPTLPAEIEAMSGQRLHWQKEMREEQSPAAPPENAQNSVQTPAENAQTAQNCTKPAAPSPVETVRRAPEPGRNSPCPCGSGLKYKRCCVSSRTATASSAATV